MNFEEHAAKALLKARGLPVPDGFVVGEPGSGGRRGARARRAVRRQGPGADRQARQGRRHPACGVAGRGPRGGGGHSRHDHRRPPDRAPSCRGAGADRRRILRRGAERPGEPRAGRAVLGDGRHGGRGNGGGRSRSDAPDRGGYRRGADRPPDRRCARRPRPERAGRRSRGLAGGPLRQLPGARCGASGDQPAGADRRRADRLPGLQVYAGRCVGRPAGGGRRERARRTA